MTKRTLPAIGVLLILGLQFAHTYAQLPPDAPPGTLEEGVGSPYPPPPGGQQKLPPTPGLSLPGGPPSSGPEALDQTLQFLKNAILPGIDADLKTYTAANREPPPSLLEARRLAASAKTWEDLVAFDAAARTYAESVAGAPRPAPPTTAALPPTLPPTLLRAGGTGSLPPPPPPPAVTLTDLGSPEQALSAMRRYAALLQNIGVDREALPPLLLADGSGSGVTTEDLRGLLPTLRSLHTQYPLPPVTTQEAMLSSVGRYLQTLLESLSHLPQAGDVPAENIRAKILSLTAEQRRVSSGDVPMDVFLGHLRATLPSVLGLSTSAPTTRQDVGTITEEVAGILTDLQDLAATVLGDPGAQERITTLLDSLRGELPPLASPSALQRWFQERASLFTTLRDAFPSPSLPDIRQDLLSVLDALQDHLTDLQESGVETQQLREQIPELTSSLQQVATEADLDQWFSRFDAFSSPLRDEP